MCPRWATRCTTCGHPPARRRPSALRVSSTHRWRTRATALRSTTRATWRASSTRRSSKELLSAPIRLALLTDAPGAVAGLEHGLRSARRRRAPTWARRARPTIRVTENGPVRVALTVTRGVDSSKFVQTISLAAGRRRQARRVRATPSTGTCRRRAQGHFPAHGDDSVATYNWDVGHHPARQRYDRKFEVPSHQWIDLTDRERQLRRHGAHRRQERLRQARRQHDPADAAAHAGLSPRGYSYSDQASQDFGHHEFIYGLAGHAGDWRAAQTDWQATAERSDGVFTTDKHAGTFGRSCRCSTERQPRTVMALKRAEASNE